MQGTIKSTIRKDNEGHEDRKNLTQSRKAAKVRGFRSGAVGIAAKDHKAAEPQPKKLKLTQRRKGAKERPRQQKFTTETQRTLRSEARGLIKISSPFYLCVFAALREIFSAFPIRAPLAAAYNSRKTT
jgi:hypothetical protein